jgi:hypothetical protein
MNNRVNIPRMLCLAMSSVALFLLITGALLLYVFDHERVPEFKASSLEKAQLESAINEQSDLIRLKSVCLAYTSGLQELLGAGVSARTYVAQISARLSWILLVSSAVFLVTFIYLFRALGRPRQ